MKLTKKLKTQEIENPFRVPPPFKPEKTRCRIALGHYDYHDDMYRVFVDGDKEATKFWAKVEKHIPYPDKLDDNVLEIWYFTENWLPKIKKWAVDSFDSVTFKDYKQNTLEKLK